MLLSFPPLWLVDPARTITPLLSGRRPAKGTWRSCSTSFHVVSAANKRICPNIYLPRTEYVTDFDLRMYVIHLSTGADIHIPRNDGASPFYMACMQGWINIAKMLYAMDPRVINDRTINDCTPLWIAATHGHMEIVQWLVDCSRYEVHKGQKAKHKTFLTARAFRGMSVQKAARSRGQARIAAFIEWHLHTGDGERMSSAPCGKQAWVENLGQWADELPPGTPKVEPDDYGFDALNINCRGECSRDFSVHPKRESAACNSYFSLSFVVFASPYSVDGRGEHVSGPRKRPSICHGR
jgi:hypothetical protein